ncbi:RNA polymerase sigma factor [Salinispira pacifica]|uniref:RNA polymerase sigma factor RpoE n=1 Tax=Salinispira pacifica TaxID=1307761 RepID=V5WE10_9SPIO|nr:RNA polymerase sigma factor [Salinispira pacifica]AHC13819.1 RNA polymerase sigma factor RpoE [Salinispira pacifica]
MRNESTLTFHEIVNRHGRSLYNLCYRILGHPEDAEDALQEIFMKIHDSLPQFKGDSSLYTWMYRIAVNHCIRTKGRIERVAEKAPKALDIRELNGPPPDLEPDLSPQERKILIDELSLEIRDTCHFFLTFRLTREQRIAFILRDVMGLSYKHISEILDISESVVKSRIYRSRANLEKHFSEKCSLHQSENPCSCEGKLGYVLKEYPMVMKDVRKRAENPDYYKLVSQLIGRRFGSVREAYASLHDLPFPKELLEKYQ